MAAIGLNKRNRGGTHLSVWDKESAICLGAPRARPTLARCPSLATSTRGGEGEGMKALRVQGGLLVPGVSGVLGGGGALCMHICMV